MRACCPGAPVLVDDSDANARRWPRRSTRRHAVTAPRAAPRALSSGSRQGVSAQRRQPARREVLRVAFEQTGLELDAAGSARAARRLREALLERDDVELVHLAQPPGPRGVRSRRAGAGARARLVPGRRCRAVRGGWAWTSLHCPMPLAPPRAHAFRGRDAGRRAGLGPPGVVQPRATCARTGWCSRPPLRRAAGVLVPSRPHARGRAAAVLELDPERVDVIPYGVDPRFTPGPARGPDRTGVEGRTCWPWGRCSRARTSRRR